LIMRSYKAGPRGGSGDGGNTGWIYRQNGGNGGWGAAVGYNGDGGGGARGGQGGHRSHSGGGGGSGYSNGEPTNVDADKSNISFGENRGDSYFEIGLTSYSDGLFEDDQGRILIFSCATYGKDPRTLTKTTGKVMPGTDTCIDDARWQNFKSLAKDGMFDWRLTGCKSGSVGAKRTKVTTPSPYNMYRMMNNPCGGGVKLRDSLTDWYDTNYAYELIVLAWDETSGNTIGGSDYSMLSWSPASNHGFGFYGLSSCALYIPGLGSSPNWGFFTGSTFAQQMYDHYTVEYWILPPGVPGFTG